MMAASEREEWTRCERSYTLIHPSDETVDSRTVWAAERGEGEWRRVERDLILLVSMLCVYEFRMAKDYVVPRYQVHDPTADIRPLAKQA